LVRQPNSHRRKRENPVSYLPVEEKRAIAFLLKHSLGEAPNNDLLFALYLAAEI